MSKITMILTLLGALLVCTVPFIEAEAEAEADPSFLKYKYFDHPFDNYAPPRQPFIPPRRFTHGEHHRPFHSSAPHIQFGSESHPYHIFFNHNPTRNNPFNKNINHPLAHIRPMFPLDDPVSNPSPHDRPSIQDQKHAHGPEPHGTMMSVPVTASLANAPLVGFLLLQPQTPVREIGSPFTPSLWSFGNQNWQEPLKQSPVFHQERQEVRRGSSCSNGAHSGTCYPASDCTGKGGRPINYCADFSKFCCVFYLTCGATSSEETSYFRNTNYPLKQKVKGSCSFTVTKRNSDYCGLRIKTGDLDLPASIGYCEDASFNIDVGGKGYEPLCGELSDSTYDVSFGNADSAILSFDTALSAKITWQIEIKQTKCNPAGVTESWPTGSGNQPIIIPMNPPEMPHTTETQNQGPLSIGLEVTTKRDARCGIQGIRREDITRTQPDQEELDGELIDSELIANRKTEDERHRVSYNPLLTSFEWAVPQLTDADLYKYKGTSPLVSNRITFGQIAAKSEFPWQIAMYSKGRFHCGASLISDKHALTAAHCIRRYKYSPHFLKLIIGDYDVSNTLDGPSLTRGVGRIAVHPGYSTISLKFDVGVVTLDSPVPLSSSVAPICIPPFDIPLEGTVPTVTGWGRDEHNRLQNVLMKLSASVVDNAECDRRWVNSGAPKGIITHTMMCMDPQYGDSCKGDSGGPSILQYPAGSGIYVQVGIVSFGSATCTDKKLPGVYTRVGLVGDWIRQQMNS